MKRTITIKRGEDPSPLVSTGDVAIRFGTTPDLVSKWTKRTYLNTPEPIAVTAAGPVWFWPDWLEWANEYRPELATEYAIETLANPV